MSMKYIIYDDNQVFIFDQSWSHQNVVFNLNLENILSAGMIDIRDNIITCWGESTTLDIKSRKSVDTNIILKYLKSSS